MITKSPKNWLDSRRERAARRRAYHALCELDSRMLKDIGLTRSDLGSFKNFDSKIR